MGALVDYLFLTSQSTPYDAYINENSPRIGINNLANQSNIQSQIGTLPTNPAYLAALPNTDERWKSQGIPSHLFRVVISSEQAEFIDYFGIAAHRGLIGKQIRVVIRRYGYPNVDIAPFMVTKSTPIFRLIEAAECNEVLIIFEGDGSDFDIDIGFISIGQTVALPRRIYVGHSPMPFSRRPETRFLVSDNGTFLGQEKQKTLMRSSVSMSNIPPDYYRDIIYPSFQLPAETQPFFWSWRPGTYPDEVAFCWLPTGQFNQQNEKPNGFMNISFDLMGHINEY